MSTSAGTTVRFKRLHTRPRDCIQAVAINVRLTGAAEHGCASQAAVLVSEVDLGALGSDEAFQNLSGVFGLVRLGMLQGFAPCLVNAVQPSIREGLGD